jgi:FtsZ-binding cell division protein ZapB
MLRTAHALLLTVLVAQPSRAQTDDLVAQARSHVAAVRMVDGSLERTWLLGDARMGLPTDTNVVHMAGADALVRSVAADSLDAQLDQLEAYVARLVERDRVLQADNEALTTANQALAGEVAGLRSETSRLQAENDRLRAAADEGDREVRSRLGRLLEALKGLFE